MEPLALVVSFTVTPLPADTVVFAFTTSDFKPSIALAFSPTLPFKPLIPSVAALILSIVDWSMATS